MRSWWAEHFLPGKYPGATEHLYIWNDMNEPSVFNGPEARTLPSRRDCATASLQAMVMIRVSCMVGIGVRDRARVSKRLSVLIDMILLSCTAANHRSRVLL